MTTLNAGDKTFSLECATADDVADIVALLVDDPLGQTRETAPLERYLAAFADIDRDPNQTLLVLRDDTGAVAGTVQLTVIACLARGGTKRLQVEAVRLASHVRGLGLGTALFQWIAEFATDHGARMVQLTSDARRTDAQRFYERLGFTASHVGYKRFL
ncbi:GNAT family N-acetyltransferase [Corynebacterium ammoniagenes]|uniref:GNAT family acetyltransferase n=1 Tax=Corynebacterium ammoniagenes TaxID=1697 RepID=A0AAV5G8V8_CORAM|nr:GNAT family N-acetyltransferase [Corynebacterium ammoniagenes]GJN43073.1 GNAT family acetyltransferase [Corynebacterium ammoniagenes]